MINYLYKPVIQNFKLLRVKGQERLWLNGHSNTHAICPQEVNPCLHRRADGRAVVVGSPSSPTATKSRQLNIAGELTSINQQQQMKRID